MTDELEPCPFCREEGGHIVRCIDCEADVARTPTPAPQGAPETIAQRLHREQRAKLRSMQHNIDGLKHALRMPDARNDTRARNEALEEAADKDLIEQAINDTFGEGGTIRGAAEYVAECIRALKTDTQGE